MQDREKLRSSLNQTIHEIVDKHFRGKDKNASQGNQSDEQNKTSEIDPHLVLKVQDDQKQAFLAAAQSRLSTHSTGGISASKYQLASQQAVQKKKLHLANAEKHQELSEEQAQAVAVKATEDKKDVEKTWRLLQNLKSSTSDMILDDVESVLSLIGLNKNVASLNNSESSATVTTGGNFKESEDTDPSKDPPASAVSQSKSDATSHHDDPEFEASAERLAGFRRALGLLERAMTLERQNPSVPEKEDKKESDDRPG